MNPAQKNRIRRRTKEERRQNRRENRETKRQENFTSLLTPKRAAHIAKANANLEYRPLEREIQGELRGSRKHEGDISGYYTGLDNLISTQQAEGAAADAATRDAINSQIANAGAQSAAGLQQLADQNAGRAAMAGGAVSPTLQSTAALGNANLAQSRIAMNMPTIAAGASFQKFTGGRRVSAAERGIEAHKANQAQTRKIAEDLRNAKVEKGRAMVSGLQKLREGDRDFTVQNKAFGLKAKEAANSAGYNAALKDQSLKGLQGTKISAAAQTTAAKLYGEGKKQQAAATENAARLYTEGKITAAQYQTRIAKIQAGASRHGDQAQENVAGTYAQQDFSNAYATAQSYYKQRIQSGKPMNANAWNELEAILIQEGTKGAAAKQAVNRLKHEHSIGSDVNGPGLGR